MTTFLYSDIANGDSIAFDSRTDSLQIDTGSLSAADFTLTASADGAGIRFSNESKQFTLVGASLGGLSSDNVTFADGSMLVNAGLSNDYASSLTGTVHDDLLIGSRAQEIRLVATSADGELADSSSNHPAVSADGRFVVFNSDSRNLTGMPDNNGEDVFIKDLLTGTVMRVSENADGEDATDPNNGWASYDAVVSADGRFVAFQSYASNLVKGDTNGWADIFLKDLQTGEVTRVSTSTSGGQANTTGTSSGASISADGRYVAFQTASSNLVSGDTNSASDIFVKDTVTGVLTRVSTTSAGGQANSGLYDYGSSDAQISADGRFVVFTSYSTNLVAGDDNGAYSSDIFVKNLLTGEIVCASTDSSGDFAYGEASNASISSDGRHVVFESWADLLGDGLNGHGSIYMRDLQTGDLTRIKAAGGGDYGQSPQISGNGRFVVFSTSSALTAGDTNGVADVYVKDVVTGKVALVSHAADGGQANEQSMMANISLDGSTIVFRNDGTGLTDDDPPYSNVFVVSNPLFARTLSGGAGNDVYVIDNAADRVVEQGNQGNDAVRASVSYTLTDNVERLALTGSDAISGTGNALANRITGNGAANAINGGAGADAMLGGGGDDIYTVDNNGDVITESAGGGTDSVRSSVSLVLSAEVENLTLTGSGNLNGTGNASVNRISGNAGNNVLNGGAGADTVTYFTASAGVTVDLSASGAQATGGAGNDTLISFENLTGSAYADRLTGTAAANSIDGGAGIDTMTGGAGNDTYTVDNTGDQTLELGDGGVDLVRSSTSLTLQANVENLTLTGIVAISGTGNSLANTLVGNGASNALSGASGNDTLDGGGGKDTLTGGTGDDVYVVDNSGEQIVELAGGGTDTAQSSVHFALQAEVENLTLTGTAAINGTGNSLGNVIAGNGASNVLNGGAGIDTMTGGAGNDTYIVDNVSDRTLEVAGGGSDLVQASISLTLQAEVEKLTLTGSLAINATGNALANALTGNTAANVLDGGAGADTMSGGGGNDSYIVDNAGDRVLDVDDNGMDTVKASVNFSLAGTGTENLILTGTSAINGTGNAAANDILGNGSANLIDGGEGSDTMTGGGGDDTYIVDSVWDQVVEKAGGGTDTVWSAFSYTLGADLENLTVGSWSDGTGNALANILTGGTHDNVLDGKAGADTLIGGDGWDTYIVDQAGDVVIEGTGEWSGMDTIESPIDWTLSTNLEWLQLTGSANINGTGNAAHNHIYGNAGNNVLDGGTGGIDRFIGGGGNDVFVMHDIAGDIIEYLHHGLDRVKIDQSDLRIGDGDTVIDSAASISGPNGFSNAAELVIVTGNISGDIDTGSAAAAIGRASSAYAVGDTRLFVVDNGTDSTVYLFKSANSDAVVSANELSVVVSLLETPWTDAGDYVFGA